MTMTTPSLGTIARKVSFGSTGRFTKQRLRGKTDERAEAMKWKRLLRWALQAEARALLPNERVAECLRKLNPIAGNVEVLHNAEHQVAHYKSLIVCGSVWLCPLCAAKISERRRDELIQAITAHITQQGAVYMATYTISHTRFDDLPDLLRTFLRARKRLKQGEYAQRRKGSFGVVGTISVLETTWSLLNHWHPHIHELIFTVAQQDERGVSAYEAVSRMAWKQAAERERLHMNEHGYRLDRTFGAVADYIAKFGREPPCTPWGVEAEMTKGHLKHGRGPVEHLTPFGVLYQVYLGQEELIPVFKEYARCFKGRHQLTWSSGLRRRLLGDGREKTDEELAAEEREEAVLLGRLTRRQWRVVLANDVRGELLEVAHRGDWQRVIAFLASIGSDITEEEPAYAV